MKATNVIMVRRSAGFSLLELLLTLAIGSIFLLAGLPLFSHYQSRQTNHRVVQQLQHLLAYARGRAIAGNQTVSICGSRDKQHCDGDWQGDLLVLNNQSKKLLYQTHLNQTGYTLGWRGSFGRNQQLAFNPEGFANQQGRFTLCPKRHLADLSANHGTALVLSYTGRVRVESIDCH